MAVATHQMKKVPVTTYKEEREITLTLTEKEAGLIYALMAKINSVGGTEGNQIWGVLESIDKERRLPRPSLVNGRYSSNAGRPVDTIEFKF